MQRKRGFTLVELLVVIAIIAILASITIVGVNAAREAARRAQCVNNQREIGIALINYANNNKGLPGLATTVIGKEFSWAQAILPELSEQKLYDAFFNDTPPHTNLPILICPSGDKTIADEHALSYVVNAGPGIDGAITSTVSAKFALFKDMRASGMKLKRVQLDEIKDGVSNTIILSENLQAGCWIVEPDWTTTPDEQSEKAIAECGFQWRGNDDPLTRTSPLRVNEDRHENYKRDPSNYPPPAPLTPLSYVRPSSNHPGTVMMLYADGHVEAMKDDIEPHLYYDQMCPDDGEGRVFSPKIYWPRPGE